MSAVWAIAALAEGKTVEDYREGGNSMSGVINHMQPVTLRPIVDSAKLSKGDIVLVRVRRSTYTHFVKATRPNQVQIGNNFGRINGWTHVNNVYGIVTAIGGCPRKNSQYSTAD